MNEFFSALYVHDMVAGFDNRVSDGEVVDFGPSGSDFPIASPDSITVTTEFGVVEESGTITIISASGPSPHHQVFDNDTEDESNVEMTEDLNHELHASLSQLQLSTHDSEIEHMQDASDEEADDDFDADAESAFIEEFMDDDADDNGGMLTPTATAAA
jgi:hypothetical protein